MSYYPDCQRYQLLYARYLYSRDPAELIRYVLDSLDILNLEDMRILDICGGNGRLSRESLDFGAKHVLLLDRSPDMIIDAFFEDEDEDRFSIVTKDVFDYLHNFDEEQFDVVFCQQAANYWLVDSEAVDLLSKAIVPRGFFVFNTFNKRPPRHIIPKQYMFQGRRYTEISYATDQDVPEESKADGVCWVNHVQMCEEIEPHMTRFLYLPPDRWDYILSQHFGVTRHRLNRTDIYVCKH